MTSPDPSNPFAPIGMPPLGNTLGAESRSSAITLARFRSDTPDPVVKSLPDQDAFMAIMQVTALPAHDLWIDGKHYPISAGPPSVLNIANLNHPVVCRISGHFENVHLHIPRAALDDIAEDANAPRVERLFAPHAWNTVDPVIQGLQAALLNALERPQEAGRLFTDHMLLALLAHLARTYGGMREGARHRAGGLAPWQERRAKDLVAANLGKEMSLEEIAGECELSVSYFSRAFKATTGLTPHGWLQTCRVERAKDLLVGSGLSLAEIALACGFADQSHFTRIFSRHAGSTPGAWQRLRRAA